MQQDVNNDPVLQSVLQDLELTRKKIRATRLKSFGFIALGAIYITIGIVTGMVSLWIFIPGAIALITGIYIYTTTNGTFAAYRNDFKQKIIGTALRSIDESLIIEPNTGISEAEFVDAQLFTQEPDRYKSEDQVSGKADKTNFYFSEAHAEYKTVTTDSKGRRQETWHDIFKGIIFAADFNKNFSGVTVVRPKDLGSKLSAWISKAVPFFSADSKVVELENVDFSKLFITHSSDQIEARYILTPALMDKLCLLNDKCNYTISLSFIRSSMYIAFPLDEDYFEPPLYKSILEPSCLERDLNVIRFMYDIVKDLDLNTRIWSKS